MQSMLHLSGYNCAFFGFLRLLGLTVTDTVTCYQILREVHHRAGHQPGALKSRGLLGGDEEKYQRGEIQAQPQQQLRPGGQ